MVDLSIIYSKTGKGLHARNAADAGLSTQQLEILNFIDGQSKAEEFLNKSNAFTEKELAAALSQLESSGFIRLVVATQSTADDWGLTSNFTPMVVEEFKSVEMIEDELRAKAAQEKQEAEYIAAEKAKEKIRWKAVINAAKEAAAKEQVRLERERIARDAVVARQIQEDQHKRDNETRARAAEAAKLKAQAKAERKVQQEADRLAGAEAKEYARREIDHINRKAVVARKIQEDQHKRDNEARARAAEAAKLKAQAEAEWKVQQEADRLASAEAKECASREIDRINRKAAQAQKEAEEKAKIEAQKQEQARLEIERIAQEATRAAEKAKKKAEAEAQFKVEETRLENERLEKAQQAQLEAERLARAENEAYLEALHKAKAERKAQEAAELKRIKFAEKEQAETEAKEVARLEMARVVRKAEEARKLVESQAKEARQAAKRKIKAEEQTRLQAARKVEDDAEQAGVDAEAAEKNKIVLQRAAQREMERFAREVEDANKNREALQIAEAARTRLQTTRIEAELAELQAQKQRQIEAKQELKEATEQQLAAQQAQNKVEQIRAKADEKAALDAKELARQEMARIAQEADSLRSQTNQATLTKPIKNGRFKASRTAKLKISSLESQKTPEFQKYEADKKAQKITTIQQRKAVTQADTDETQAKSAAKRQQNSSGKAASKRTPIDLNSIFLNSVKWIAKLVKTTLIVGFILALLLTGILHLININPLIASVEKLATDSLGKHVHIGQMRASLWPQPHLVLSDISIGGINSDNALKATSIQVIPDTGTLFEDIKRVKSLAIAGLVVDESNAVESLMLIHHIGKAQSLKVEQLNLSDLRFKVKDLVLGPFDGSLVLNEAGELNDVNLHGVDHALSAQIKPQGAAYAITLTGSNWPLPLNPNIVFDELQANASINQNQMTFSQISGAMFGGNISAKAVLDWSSGWHTTGNFTLTNANAQQLLKAFANKASVDGEVNITGDFASASTKASNLADKPAITANIALKNGKINGVDLAHAVMFNQNASLAGEATAFDKLTSSLQVKDGQYHYKQIALDTKQFHANGNVDIAQNQVITGRINAALVAQSRRLQASFELAGTLSDVKRQ